MRRQVNIHLSEDEFSQLKAIADRFGIKPGAQMRKFLKMGLRLADKGGNERPDEARSS
jgi:hypothetical protein